MGKTSVSGLRRWWPASPRSCRPCKTGRETPLGQNSTLPDCDRQVTCCSQGRGQPARQKPGGARQCSGQLGPARCEAGLNSTVLFPCITLAAAFNLAAVVADHRGAGGLEARRAQGRLLEDDGWSPKSDSGRLPHDSGLAEALGLRSPALLLAAAQLTLLVRSGLAEFAIMPPLPGWRGLAAVERGRAGSIPSPASIVGYRVVALPAVAALEPAGAPAAWARL